MTQPEGFNDNNGRVYRLHTEGDKFIAVLYVDDGIIAVMITSSINQFLRKLETEFQITFGSLEYFLNVRIKRDHNNLIFINQKAYAEKVIRKFSMEAKTVSTPIEKIILMKKEALN